MNVSLWTNRTGSLAHNDTINQTIRNNLFVVDVLKKLSESNNWGEAFFFRNSTKIISNANYNVDGMTADDYGFMYVIDEVFTTYRSIDGGVTWQIVNSSYGDTLRIKTMSSDCSNIYFSNGNSDVFKSSNFGVTWIQVEDNSPGA